MSDDEIRARLAALGVTGDFDVHQRGDSRVSEPPDTRAPFPVLISAEELMGMVFPEPRWAVPGLFPEGLTLLVGAPKLGKSWLGLNAGLAVALGGRAIGKIAVKGGDVLYLALEDTERRLQERLATILQGEAAPARLSLATAWPTLANGAAIHLSGWLDHHPDARLVIVDTFQKLRGPIPGNQNLYGGDYAAAGELKRVADRHGVAVVCIHHTRKASADDPLDMVSGSAGLAGAADTTCVLKREIGRHDATLYIRGRDVPEADHALSFDAATCAWTLLGDADTYRVSEERQQILDLLREAISPMSPKHIAEALGKKDGAVRYLLHKMAKSGDVDGVGGAYRLPVPPTNSAITANADQHHGESVRTVSGVSRRDSHPCVQCGQPVETPGVLACDQHGGADSRPVDWPHLCIEPGCKNRCSPPHRYRCDAHIPGEAAA